tara:strand:- start:279 stop:467 length:189 start_codon:yes stop_codon:yes gene_type:complete
MMENLRHRARQNGINIPKGALGITPRIGHTEPLLNKIALKDIKKKFRIWKKRHCRDLQLLLL